MPSKRSPTATGIRLNLFPTIRAAALSMGMSGVTVITDLLISESTRMATTDEYCPSAYILVS